MGLTVISSSNIGTRMAGDIDSNLGCEISVADLSAKSALSVLFLVLMSSASSAVLSARDGEFSVVDKLSIMGK